MTAPWVQRRRRTLRLNVELLHGLPRVGGLAPRPQNGGLQADGGALRWDGCPAFAACLGVAARLDWGSLSCGVCKVRRAMG
jgi:hypothetical protein